ncbi:SMP-30/gluconolactonase/LRE family protein [Granulicella sp. L60]|uniref:SMP-30/gluconolactonase/LRE family protein n=1 Tax=Granulicella sp. L60 TaxID=1641866 RepID=UPI00131E3EE5|nr:SMP-30/gluconolactonase/LRE family protein [Granulicella sp. L60]
MSPLATAQGSPTNVSQSIVANYENNGLSSPGALAVGGNGNVFIVDTGNNRVVEEPWNSTTRSYGTQTILIGGLFSPSGVAVDSNGSVFIVDTGNNRVIEIPLDHSTGAYGPEKIVGLGLAGPKGVAVAPDGTVYIADTGNNRVIEVPWDHKTGSYGPQTTVGINLFDPEAVAIGQQGKLLIANTGNGSVVEVPTECNATNSCTTQTIVANQQNNGLTNPNDLAVDPDGSLYITQPNNNQVIELPWNRSTGTYGTQTTVGSDLDGPRGVAVDAIGNIYIADTLTNRVLKITKQAAGTRRSGGRTGGITHPLQ